MSESPQCPHCHEPLAAGLRLEGLCPRCLLLLGMGADLSVYRRIGPFEVLEEIGRGGMGVVFKAYQTRLHRVVALKVLSKSLADDKAFLHRFEREAQAAAALNHPNIVTVYDVGADAGQRYFAMEYVDGPNLQERLNAEGPMEWTEALRIAQQALRGLAAAHRIGVVHRDIKPHNIIINGAGLVKVADFGLAKRRDDPTGTATLPGVVVGSPAYMAPEQARGAEVDARTDLFALGGVLYTLLTGQPPFRGENPAQLLQNLLFEPPPALRSVNGAVPLSVARLVERALEKDPADRFASATDMKNAVESALGGAADTRLMTPSARARSRRTWRAAISLALVLCLAAAVGIGLIQRGRTRAASPLSQKTTSSKESGPVDGGFYDSHLAAQVRKTLNLAAGESIGPDRLGALVRLEAANLGVTDLRGIEQAKNLEFLNLQGNPIRDLAPLNELSALVSLDLGRIFVLDGQQLAHLRSLTNLRCLHFDGIEHMDEAFEIISGIPTIQVLGVNGGHTGSARGIRHLGRLKGLHGLSLMNFENPIDEAFEAIGALKGLEYLNLTGSNVADAGIERLSGLDRLRFVALWKSTVTDRGFKTLAQLPHLDILILQGEKITDDGLRAVAACPNLEYLGAQDCRLITDAGIEALAAAKQLTTLNVCGCPGVTDKGIESLAPAPALRELHVGPGPAADTAGLEALAKLPRLTYLVVRPAKPLSAPYIDILVTLKSLRFLGIPEESLAPDDLIRLRTALPACEVRTQLDPIVVRRYSGPS